MRALSFRAASMCENAKSPASKCQCRCRGAAHGMGRARDERTAYEALPREDPHHVPEKKSKPKKRAELRREVEKVQARLFKEI